jgi:hypothetical protein
VIKGLEARARLPRLGVIRLGVKVRNAEGKEHPKEVEYFVCPPELSALLPERPTRIPVLFPADDPHRVLVADYVRYAGRLLTLKCDGERFTELPVQGGELVGPCRKEAGKPCPCKAKPLGRLNVILLDGPVGVYQVLIGGEQRLADLMVELEVFRRTFGRLTDIVFELERVATETQVRTEGGKRLPKTGWPVHVRCNFTVAQALKARGLDIKSLPAAPPDDEDEETLVPEEPAGSNGHGKPEATPEAEFDISLAYKSAIDLLSVTAHAYGLYLRATYGVGADDITPAQLAEQQRILAKAKADPATRDNLKAAVIAGANKAAGQPRLL